MKPGLGQACSKRLPMSSPLHLDVFVVPYKPIVGVIPPMGAGEPTWPVSSVSLISGEQDAVLIDAPVTAEDAGRLWTGSVASARTSPRFTLRTGTATTSSGSIRS